MCKYGSVSGARFVLYCRGRGQQRTEALCRCSCSKRCAELRWCYQVLTHSAVTVACSLLCSSARDSETNEKVAIKKVSGCFESPVDAKRMLREVKLLTHLRHENVIGLRDILPPPSPSAASYKDVYLVYELMDTDLHQIIRSPQQLSPEHVGYFVYQVCAPQHVLLES